jgi:hypothetical protein
MHYYTSEDAVKLAEYVSNLALKENYVVLVTNGPRTGKYDAKTGKELDVHNKNITDHVTLKFTEILNQNFKNFLLSHHATFESDTHVSFPAGQEW